MSVTVFRLRMMNSQDRVRNLFMHMYTLECKGGRIDFRRWDGGMAISREVWVRQDA